MAKFQVKVGSRFDVEAVDLDNEAEFLAAAATAAEKVEDASTRSRALLGLGVAATAALIVATVLGVHDGSFDEVDAVWSAIALPLGVIIDRYFLK